MQVISHHVNKLSQKADELLKVYSNKIDRKTIDNRIDWHSYFLRLAQQVSTRSSDSQTKHGAIIVNDDHEIVATGYNGVLRDIDNYQLPNQRPEKYCWHIHAEANSILSCARQGKSTLNTTIYVTGEPCINCYQYIWQSGIKRVIFGQQNSHMHDEEMLTKIELFKFLTQLTILEIKVDKEP